jgi:CRISPR-associated protein Cmr6
VAIVIAKWLNSIYSTISASLPLWRKIQDTNDIGEINNSEELRKFLENLYQDCKTYCKKPNSQFGESLPWREAWNPKYVTVYSAITTESKAVCLFHNQTFNLTPAIGGKNREGAPEYTSSVWHRMLPINADPMGNPQYLEIVTLFHQLREPWNRKLYPFIEALEKNGLNYTWGKSRTEINCEHKDVEENARPKPKKQKNIPT